MQVLFLGGSNEIGASCIAVEMAGKWFIVDAGARLSRETSTTSLPKFDFLQNRDPQAIFITHAHSDHIEALPLLHKLFPSVPIYASQATALLMRIMLDNTHFLMEYRAQERNEVTCYTSEMLADTLEQVQPLPVDPTFILPELPGLTIYTSLAGHIAGALSLGFTSPDDSLIISGDICLKEQHTVSKAVPPTIHQPDLLIMEATYGANRLRQRKDEEENLLQIIMEGIYQKKGHILIPCFGLGRGQEILTMLMKAILNGKIPRFPIYVDGLTQKICAAYHHFPDALAPDLAQQIRQGAQPFDGNIIQCVAHGPKHRERILSGSPACIVTSSGKLVGGPSIWYASRLVSQSAASILFTNSQDEESPGRCLLDVANGYRKTLDLNGETVPVRCHIAQYQFSTHADAEELLLYAQSVQPRHIALVHGENNARHALYTSLRKHIASPNMEILLPLNGEMCTLTQGKITPCLPIDESNEITYPAPLLQVNINKYTYNEEYKMTSLDVIECVITHLKRANICQVKQIRCNNEAKTVILDLDCPPEQWANCRTELDQLADETGWQIATEEESLQCYLVGELKQLLPPALKPLAFSLYISQKHLYVACLGRGEEELIEDIKHCFQQKTSWQLALECYDLLIDSEQLQVSHTNSRPLLEQPSKMWPYTEGEAVLFAQERLQILTGFLRVTVKKPGTNLLEVRFNFPQKMQQIYADHLASIEKDIGWSISVHPNANEKALREEAECCLPTDIRVEKCSYRQDERRLTLTYSGRVTLDQLAQARQHFHEATHWNLELNP